MFAQPMPLSRIQRIAVAAVWLLLGCLLLMQGPWQTAHPNVGTDAVRAPTTIVGRGGGNSSFWHRARWDRTSQGGVERRNDKPSCPVGSSPCDVGGWQSPAVQAPSRDINEPRHVWVLSAAPNARYRAQQARAPPNPRGSRAHSRLGRNLPSRA
jgi:hypothetical protein